MTDREVRIRPQARRAPRPGGGGPAPRHPLSAAAGARCRAGRGVRPSRATGSRARDGRRGSARRAADRAADPGAGTLARRGAAGRGARLRVPAMACDAAGAANSKTSTSICSRRICRSTPIWTGDSRIGFEPLSSAEPHPRRCRPGRLGGARRRSRSSRPPGTSCRSTTGRCWPPRLGLEQPRCAAQDEVAGARPALSDAAPGPATAHPDADARMVALDAGPAQRGARAVQVAQVAAAGQEKRNARRSGRSTRGCRRTRNASSRPEPPPQGDRRHARAGPGAARCLAATGRRDTAGVERASPPASAVNASDRPRIGARQGVAGFAVSTDRGTRRLHADATPLRRPLRAGVKRASPDVASARCGYEALLLVAMAFVAGFAVPAVRPPAGASHSTLTRSVRRLRAHVRCSCALVAGAAVYYAWCWSDGRRTLPQKTWRLRLVDAHGATLEPHAGADPLCRRVDRAGARAGGYAALQPVGLRPERARLRRTQLLLGDRRSGSAVPARPDRRDARRAGRPDEPTAADPMTVLPCAASMTAMRSRNAFADPARLVVVSLCAAWCDTCSEFRAAYERIAQARPQTTFVWLDIEDDADDRRRRRRREFSDARHLPRQRGAALRRLAAARNDDRPAGRRTRPQRCDVRSAHRRDCRLAA